MSTREEPESAAIHDAVHGPISLRGWQNPASDTLQRVAHSRELERLRGVKQLAFASYAFPAADHSRYAHSLGTMHMMRCLLEAHPEAILGGIDLCALEKAFPGLGDLSGDLDERRRLIGEHMLLAALIQDTGELPFEQATSLVLSPAPQVKQLIEERLGGVPDLASSKTVFTLACICHSQALAEAEDVDLPFLAFLATGYHDTGGSTIPAEFVALRHLLDGAIDADRLDYVFRDAHHTIGHIGGPAGVVDSLQAIDGKGAVFSEPGPVLDFFVTRASLWSRVYFSPQNRLRLTLLRTICKCVQVTGLHAEFFGDTPHQGSLSYEDFCATDDMSVAAWVRRLAKSDEVDRRTKWLNLGRSTKAALTALQPDASPYEAAWLPAKEVSEGEDEDLPLPSELFFDSYADYRNHQLYEPGSVRLQNHRYRYAEEETIALEQCAGPLSNVLENQWTAQGPENGVLVFLPRRQTGAVWQEVQSRIEDGRLQRQLAYTDSALRSRIHDTRRHPDFEGPSLFISHAFADRHFIERVAAILRASKQQYFFWATPLDGHGESTVRNSEEGVEQAEAALIVLSQTYLAHMADQSGNIAREIQTMTRRVQAAELGVRAISLEPPEMIADALAWRTLGLEGPPIAASLAQYDDTRLSAVIEREVEALRRNLENLGEAL